MSENPTVEETRRKLAELGQRIHAAKALGACDRISDDASKAWSDMVDTHADITRRLQSAASQSPAFIEGLRFDVDVLNHSFERWMASVEGTFGKDNGEKQRG